MNQRTALWSIAIALALLTPGVAHAHGEEGLIIFVLWIVPLWTWFAHISARARVDADDRRHLGVLSPVAALAGMVWMFLFPVAFGGSSSLGFVLAPFGLSIGAGPAAAYLYGRGYHGRAATFVGIPLALLASCGMMGA